MIASPFLGFGILDRLRLHAQQRPDHLAFRFLRDDHGSDTRTFGQLDQRVRGLAAWLSEHAAPGDRALLLYPPGLDFLEAFLACLAAGILAVPAYPPRRNRNAERLSSILDSAGPRLVLTTRPLLPNLPIKGPMLLATDDVPATSNEAWDLPPITGDRMAFLQFTSGSTGTPRGVIVTHGNIAANQRAIQTAFGHTPECITVSWLPTYHDMGLIGQMLQPLFVGMLSVFMSPVAFLREPIRWLRAITEYRGTTTGGPNFAYDHCVRCITEEQKEGLNLGSLRVAYNGAEPVRAETLDRFTQAFGRVGFRPQAFLPCYGLAEATLLVSGGPARQGPNRVWLHGPSLEEHRVREVAPDDAEARPFVGSGRLTVGTRILIVHPETRTECQPGQVGEVWVASDSVTGGYWECPEATRETFRAYLADTGEGPFLRTGDTGFVRDGQLFITGRLKDLIIVRGRNLYPQDVEAAVERVVPFARPNALAAFSVETEGGERLAVVIEADRALVHKAQAAKEANGRGAADLNDLVGRVRQAVSDEFEVPVWSVTFVRPGSFPRTSSGKVQRRACRKSLLAGQLEVVHGWQASFREGEAPAEPAEGSKIEDRGSRIDRSILDPRSSILDPPCLQRLIHDKVLAWRRTEGDAGNQSIDDHASLVSLGVDSVGAAAIAIEVERATGLRMSPDLIYEYPTIDQLAQYLESRLGREDLLLADSSNAAGFPRRRGSALLPKVAGLSRRTNRLRERGRYFFETTVTEYDGPRVKVDDRWMLMFSSYSYLGLIGHPEVNSSVKKAIDDFGAGCHGARLIAGTTELHRLFEHEIADFLGSEAAMVFNTGYVANLATVAALVGPDDCVIGDEYNHASIVDGARFSGAEALTFRHNDMRSLQERLGEAGGRGKLVVVDGVYSMEGDVAPLPEICALCDRYDALLMVDEAHSLGVLGANGRGVQEHFGLPADAIDLKMGTLSKSLGSCGGYIAGADTLIDYLKHSARGFLFSVAAPVPQMAAALKGLQILRREPERVAVLQRNTRRFLRGLRQLGFRLTNTVTPIVPILCDTEERTLEMTARCREEGLFIVPITYPAVPMNAPRVRASVMAAHTDADIDAALDILGRAGREVGLLRSAECPEPELRT